MGLKFKIKTMIMQTLMEQSRKKKFDAAECDSFQLPADAGPLVNNSYFFGGNTEDGQSLIMRIGFRNVGFVEVFVMYKDVDGRFLTIDKQQFPTEESPMKVKCLEPGSKWHVEYDGKLVDTAASKTYHCTFSFDYTAKLYPFSALHHSDFRGMAEAFAREKWNKKFFRSLVGDTGVGADKKKYPQLHYEQTGHMEGKLILDGVEERKLSMSCIRDHAYGTRDWNLMDAHIWLIAMNDKGEGMNFSIVNYPHAKKIFCGYSSFGSDRNYSLVDYNIIAYDHKDGLGTDDMIVDCTFSNGKTVRVKSHRVDNLVTTFDGGNYYFQEGIGDFDIGGVKARGSIEYGYNRDKSRWGTYNKEQ